MTWMANRKLCQTIFPPWNIPFFIILFYFPCLFVWYWKSPWMPPLSPPPPSGGSGEVLVKPSSALAHLSSFNFLNGGMRGQKERQLSGFSPLLNHLSPKSVCFPLCVFVFALTGNTAFYSNICPNVITEPQFWCLLCRLLLDALILGKHNVGRSHTKLKCEFGFQAATNMTNDYLSEVYLLYHNFTLMVFSLQTCPSEHIESSSRDACWGVECVGGSWERRSQANVELLPQLLLFLDNEHFPTENKCDYIKYSHIQTMVTALIVLELLLSIFIDIGIGICWFSQATDPG